MSVAKYLKSNKKINCFTFAEGLKMIKTLSINSKKIIFNRIIDIIPTAEASAIYNFLDAELYDNSMYDNLSDLYNDITNSYVEIFNRRGY